MLGCSRFYVLCLGIVCLPAVGEMTGVLTRVLIGSELPPQSVPRLYRKTIVEEPQMRPQIEPRIRTWIELGRNPGKNTKE